MRSLLVPFAFAAGATLIGCGHPEDLGQQLSATGTVVASDGVTPLDRTEIDAYVIYFQVADGTEIARELTDDVQEPRGITTDVEGRFHIEATHLALSYDWEQDEWVCQDICTLWETSCEMVTEEVCVDVCEVVTYDECWDECWDECTTTCWDEVVCDDEGYCWTETICEDDCTTVCEPVCGTVTEEECYPECHDETYEVCEDVCVESVEECGWVTRTYTSYPEFSEIVGTRTEIVLRDDAGQTHVVPGETLEAGRAQRCDDGACEPLSVWLQRDRFVAPFGP
jgi:hypothetical protein